ncbi:NADP-dependent oxidoreductase domain-containing protein [Zopfochytrium polystomum]|nr:NADP-dependent oxidoreductase domain-containing protein [Zopfochytrium polystomum]
MAKWPHVILGTMTFGDLDKSGRVKDRETAQRIIDHYRSLGHTELDTARSYCGGTTEELLATLSTIGLELHTKVLPTNPGDHAPDKVIKTAFRNSLKALNQPKVDVFYLHAPDHATPELGLSNFSAWETMLIHCICKKNGYVVPTLYQGVYNVLTRGVESELFPCLSDLNMRFYAYNPLCGGLLLGKYSIEGEAERGARYDNSTNLGKRYKQRYWKQAYFDAVASIKQVADHHNISMVSLAHRWLIHHSKLDPSRGDGIIIGASTEAQAKQNLAACEEGPLPAELLEIVDSAYSITKGVQPPYFR